jgi:hypothetical protein
MQRHTKHLGERPVRWEPPQSLLHASQMRQRRPAAQIHELPRQRLEDCGFSASPSGMKVTNINNNTPNMRQQQVSAIGCALDHLSRGIVVCCCIQLFQMSRVINTLVARQQLHKMARTFYAFREQFSVPRLELHLLSVISQTNESPSGAAGLWIRQVPTPSSPGADLAADLAAGACR